MIEIRSDPPPPDEGWKRYEETLAALKELDPPLAEYEKESILGACMRGGTVMLRCKFEKDEKPAIYVENGQRK